MATPTPPASLLPPGLHLRFDNTIGISLLAAVLNSILFGILCLQCFSYFQRYPKDNVYLKCSVWALLILNTLHLAFIVQNIYLYAVTNFGNLEQLLLVPWPATTSILVTGITTVIVQSWFCYRVWIMSYRNKLLTYPLLLLFLAAVTLSFVNNIKLFFLPTFESFRAQIALFIAEIACCAAADFYVAISLCILLYNERKTVDPQYMQRAYAMLNTLIIYTIETGLLTSFVALASLITCVILPDNFIPVGLYLLLSELYSNSLMASLNARDKFRHRDYVQSTHPATVNETWRSVAFAHSGEMSSDERGTSTNVVSSRDIDEDSTKAHL